MVLRLRVPFKDPETARQYWRERKRQERAGGLDRVGHAGGPCLPATLRLSTADDILGILSEQVTLVRLDNEAGAIMKARAVGYLCSVALKAVEVGSLEARLEQLEEFAREQQP